MKPMHGKRLVMLFSLAALAAVIFILNDIAGTYYLYFFYWWYDIMMHFLGGLLIGGLSAWGVQRFIPGASLSRLLVIILVSIAAVGIGWEIFEYLTGQYIGQQSIVVDTTIDLIMDTLGAIIAALIVRKISLHTVQQEIETIPIL
jgi:uncharacterized membrane protein YjdF